MVARLHSPMQVRRGVRLPVRDPPSRWISAWPTAPRIGRRPPGHAQVIAPVRGIEQHPDRDQRREYRVNPNRHPPSGNFGSEPDSPQMPKAILAKSPTVVSRIGSDPISDQLKFPWPTRTAALSHLDMDAFYASVETARRPGAARRPVAVGGSPQSRGRGGRLQLRGARNSACARRCRWRAPCACCPELLRRTPRFRALRARLAGGMAICAECTPLVEPLSLDEAYLDVSHNAGANRSRAWSRRN